MNLKKWIDLLYKKKKIKNNCILFKLRSVDYHQHATLPNDVFELKSWVIDLRKDL